MLRATEEGVRENCSLLGFKANDLSELSEIASITAAWSALKTFQAAEDKTRAENKMLGLPNKMKPAEYASVRQAYERSQGGRLEDVRLPGAPIIEWLEREVEEGEFAAPRLSELPSRKEVLEASAGVGKQDTLGLAVTITSSGSRVNMPTKVKLAMPTNPEELRERIGLLAAGVEFFKIKQPEVKAFQKVSESMWTAHLNYVLGPKVRGKQVFDNDGNIVKTPAWSLILNYEQAIRAKAAVFMNEGDQDNDYQPMDMVAALKRARECQELRTEIFLERLHLQPSGREAQRKGKGSGASSSNEVSNQDRGKKGGGKKADAPKKVLSNDKSKVKNDVKGRGKPGKGRRLQTHHLKKPICFAYNNKKEECKQGENCPMVHVCQLCQGDHPLHLCPAA